MKTMMSGNRRSSSTPQAHRPFFLLSLTIVAIIFLNTGSAFIPSSLRIVSATTMTTTTTGTGGANTATHTSKTSLLAEVDGGLGGSSNNNDDENHETYENQDEVHQPLQLPEATNDPSIPSIKLGESIRFEEMGPVIINADGTTRRIDNWDQMTKSEQEVAWRRIAKRNEERRKALLEEQQQN